MMQSMYRTLLVAACLAVALTALPARAEDNHADVVYDGNAVPPPVHTVDDGFTNYGTVTVIGKDNSSSSTSTLIITSGGFTNHGNVTATGGNGNGVNGWGGYGISVTGGFTNQGTVTATGGNGEGNSLLRISVKKRHLCITQARFGA
ncbi:MAG: hypothetical protein LUC93_10995, partial [Planctomycetaceae bacterium]|nr:hypothetical protein [Planctomycetaceae bacterium]